MADQESDAGKARNAPADDPVVRLAALSGLKEDDIREGRDSSHGSALQEYDRLVIAGPSGITVRDVEAAVENVIFVYHDDPPVGAITPEQVAQAFYFMTPGVLWDVNGIRDSKHPALVEYERSKQRDVNRNLELGDSWTDKEKRTALKSEFNKPSRSRQALLNIVSHGMDVRQLSKVEIREAQEKIEKLIKAGHELPRAKRTANTNLRGAAIQLCRDLKVDDTNEKGWAFASAVEQMLRKPHHAAPVREVTQTSSAKPPSSPRF